MNKLYAIKTGFYSDHNSVDSIDCIWSTKDKAINHVAEEAQRHRLAQVKSKKTDKLIDIWTNGDYYVSIEEINIDNIYMFGDPK